jgi:hypothetical protein
MTGVSAAEIAQAAGGVAGPVPRHHALLVGLSLDHLAHLEAAVTTLDGEVDGGGIALTLRPETTWTRSPGSASELPSASSPTSAWT